MISASRTRVGPYLATQSQTFLQHFPTVVVTEDIQGSCVFCGNSNGTMSFHMGRFPLFLNTPIPRFQNKSIGWWVSLSVNGKSVWLDHQNIISRLVGFRPSSSTTLPKKKLPQTSNRYCGRKLQALRLVLRHLLPHKASSGHSRYGFPTQSLPKWLLALDDDTMLNPLTLLKNLGRLDPTKTMVFGHRWADKSIERAQHC